MRKDVSEVDRLASFVIIYTLQQPLPKNNQFLVSSSRQNVCVDLKGSGLKSASASCIWIKSKTFVWDTL